MLNAPVQYSLFTSAPLLCSSASAHPVPLKCIRIYVVTVFTRIKNQFQKGKFGREQKLGDNIVKITELLTKHSVDDKTPSALISLTF